MYQIPQSLLSSESFDLIFSTYDWALLNLNWPCSILLLYFLDTLLLESLYVRNLESFNNTELVDDKKKKNIFTFSLEEYDYDVDVEEGSDYDVY